MNEDNFDVIVMAFIGGIIMIALVLTINHEAKQRVRREAVARGHAEFVEDKEGNVEFKWKEIK